MKWLGVTEMKTDEIKKTLSHQTDDTRVIDVSRMA